MIRRIMTLFVYPIRLLLDNNRTRILMKHDKVISLTGIFSSLSMVALLVTAGFVLLRLISVHYQLVIFPYQAEYREGASLLLTKAFNSGVDPYAFENQPLYTNVYGFVNNLIAALFSSSVGPSFFIERALTATYISLSSLLFYKVLSKLRAPVALRAVGLVLFYASLLERGMNLMARPDSLGLLLLLASLFIPLLYGYGRTSLILSIALTVLAFYTKVYFVLGGVYLAIYLFLFVSKWKALCYGAALGLSLLISALIVNHVADLYFSNSLFGHINIADNDFDHMVKQFRMFIQFFAWLLLTLLLGLLLSLRRSRDFLTHVKRPQVDLRQLHMPFWQHANQPFVLFALSLLLSILVLYGSMGRHDGATMTYYHQLASPFLILLSIGILSRLHQARLLIVILLIPTVFYVTQFYTKNVLRRLADVSAWQRMEQLTQAEGNILNSPAIVGMLMMQDKPIYDSGETQYFPWGQDEHNLQQRYLDYKESIRAMINDQAFDMIVVNVGGTPLVDMEDVSANYQYSETLELLMPFTLQAREIQIWFPKGNVPSQAQ
jgi:hypothetical protein